MVAGARVASSLLIAFTLASGPLWAGEVYRWVDEHGQVQYGDSPPRGAQKLEGVAPPAGDGPPGGRQAQGAAAAGRGTETLGAFELRVTPRYGARPPWGAVTVELSFEPTAATGGGAVPALIASTTWTAAADGTAALREDVYVWLKPGIYQPVVKVTAASLGGRAIVLPAGGVLAIPPARCVYFGVARVRWVRLPRASLDASFRMATKLADEVGLTRLMTYYTTEGMLVYAGMDWSLPDLADPRATTARDRDLVERAKRHGCEILAR